MTYALTIVFAGLTIFYGWRAASAGSAVGTIGSILQLVMAAAMVAMLGPWAAAVPSIIGVEVFSAAALWFVYVALFAPGRGPVDPFHDYTHAWYHAAKMTSMVWMSVAMSVGAAHVPHPGTGGTGPMMTMPGSSAPAADAPGWSITVSIVVGVLFLGAALWLTTCLLDDLRTASPALRQQVLVDGAAAVVMAAGMGVSFFTLR